MGAKLHDEIDSDEVLTDKVESPPEEVVAPETSAVDIATDALLAETLDPAEADAGPGADIGAESFDPTEIASLEFDPVEDEFAQQIDVAEQIEDSLDDFLDDQA